MNRGSGSADLSTRQRARVSRGSREGRASLAWRAASFAEDWAWDGGGDGSVGRSTFDIGDVEDGLRDFDRAVRVASDDPPKTSELGMREGDVSLPFFDLMEPVFLEDNLLFVGLGFRLESCSPFFVLLREAFDSTASGASFIWVVDWNRML